MNKLYISNCRNHIFLVNELNAMLSDKTTQDVKFSVI